MGVLSSRVRVVLPFVGVCVFVLALAGPSAGGAGSVGLRVPHHHFGALDSTLGQIAAVQKAHGTAAALAAATAQNVDVAQGKVAVMVIARPGLAATAAAAVASRGGVVEHTTEDVLQALVPVAALEGLAADPSVSWVRRPPFAVADTTDEAVASTNASSVQSAGFDGTGVKVAVIDLGFQNLNQVFGDPLPAWITQKDNFHCTPAPASSGANPYDGWGPTPHGTAVAENVHQMAPGAQIELMCINDVTDLASAEQQAVTDGVKVINHSVGWFDVGRGDGSGGAGTPDPIVTDARAHGILWVNAAGNSAGDHWSGTFLPSAADPSLNDFSGGGGDVTNDVTIGAGQQACIFMKWDAWPVTTEDYDLGLFRSSDDTLVADSINDQSQGPGPPTESTCYTNSGATQNFEIAISRYSAVSTPRMDLWVVGGVSNLQYATAAGSITEPASSPDALAVGAVCWQSGALEPFSSQGPTIDGRADPAVLGPDGTSSSIYGSFSACGTTNSGFFGTSAAAPHVAGAAALLAQAYPAATPRQLETLLRSELATPAGSALWLHPPFTGGPIAFSNGQVVVTNADGTDSKTLTADSNIISSAAVSPNGAKIAFAGVQDGDWEIYVMNIDGTGRTQLTTNTGTTDTDPTWSPDGTQIAFSTNRDGNYEIYKMSSTDGSGLTRLTSNTNDETQPDWGSTGKIAFTTDVNVGGFHHWDIFTMNADGSSQTDLTNNVPSASNVDPAFSPDGSKIAFIGGTSGAPVYTMNADGTSQTNVTSGSGGVLDPAWSPDGTRLLFESGANDVYSSALNGTALARLTTTLNLQSAPAESHAIVKPFTFGTPSVSGTLRVGQPLAAVQPVWIGSSPYTTLYQWQQCTGATCSNIGGATDSDYSPVAADAGHTLRVVATATNSAGSTSANSAQTGTISALAPVIATLPTISGTAQSGLTLSVASHGTWTNSPTSFTYQWRRCANDGGGCVNIVGATNAGAYLLNAADVGSTIRIAVTASNAGGSSAASSVQTVIVAAAAGGGGGGVYPDLSVVLSADATTVPAVGSELVYHFTVADKLGTVAAFNTFADVTLPAGYTVTNTYSDRGPGCVAGSPGLVCNLDFVQPGSDGHVTIWGTVGQAGPLTISVHVRHFLNEGNPADDTATLTLQPASSGTGGGGGGGTTPPPAKALTPPYLVGGVTVGSVLRAIPPTWSAKPSRVRYQWQLCRATGCRAIVGATALRLKLKLIYAGKRVRIVATATIDGKTVKSTSQKIVVKKRA